MILSWGPLSFCVLCIPVCIVGIVVGEHNNVTLCAVFSAGEREGKHFQTPADIGEWWYDTDHAFPRKHTSQATTWP